MTDQHNDEMPKITFYQGYKKMWPFIKKYLWLAILGIILTIPVGTLDALIALFLKPFMDNVMVDKQEDFASDVPLIIVGFVIIQGLFIYSSTLINAYVAGKVQFDVQKFLFKKLHKKDCCFFDTHDSGTVIFRFYNDAITATEGLLDNFKLFITKFFSSLSLVFVLIYNSWQLSCAAIGILLFLIVPLRVVRKKVSKIMKKTIVENATVLTMYNESALGNRIIRSFTLEDKIYEQFTNSAKFLFGMNIKMVRDTNWLSPMMHVVSALGVATVIWYGGYLIVTQQITSGTFVSFIAALIMLYTPLKSIGKNYIQIQKSLLAVERIFELLDTTSVTEQEEKGDKKEFTKIEDSIVFNNVFFGYTKEKNVLENINFEIKKGQKVALVGNSGGGKTTVCSLLPRLYEINSGSITIDGKNINEYSLQSLRKNISVVFQDNFLFTGTIRQNILMGNPYASENELKQACNNACLDEFLEKLPNGIDTFIGEKGTLLSGGQKQRVAIARAFIKNAPIVILDEATSALDNKSEKIVQQALDNLMKNKTVIVIAHRLSTIIDSNKIIVINDGKIIEEGSHETLLNQNGSYASLYKTQFSKGAE